MNKIGRNDPCPCGSQKKYKRCCGKNNIITFSPEPYDHELMELIDRLHKFALENYDDHFQEVFFQMQKTYHLDHLNEEDGYFLVEHAMTWSIFNDPIFRGKTIFDIFYQKKNTRLKYTRTKNIFKTWSKIKGSIYLITAFNEAKQLYTMQNIVSKERLYYQSKDGESLGVNGYLIGIGFPLVGQKVEFFPGLMTIQPESFHKLFAEDSEFLKEAESINRHYIPMMAKIIGSGRFAEELLDWKDPIYIEIAEAFSREMEKRNYDEQLINRGVVFWNLFCYETSPRIKNPIIYIAALEYFILNNFGKRKTQREVAEKYGVSVASISAINSRFRQEVNRILEEDVESHKSAPQGMAHAPETASIELERQLRLLQQAIEDKYFDSPEEMEQFVEQFLADEIHRSKTTSPREEAQEILFQAMQTSGQEQKDLIEEALEIYPDSPDAYLLLAEQTKELRLREMLILEAINAGELDLGQEFFKENSGHFWLMPETRPYMRALMAFAEFCISTEEFTTACEFLEEIIVLNPDDNLGARYKLLTLYIGLRQFEEAERIFDQFGDEQSAEFLFNRALLTYLQKGARGEAFSQLAKADAYNSHVLDYLFHQRKLPKDPPDHFSPGDESEAIVYLKENLYLWADATPFLIEYITNH